MRMYLKCLTLVILARSVFSLKSKIPTALGRYHVTFYNVTVYFSKHQIYELPTNYFWNRTILQATRFLKSFYPHENFTTTIVRGTIPILHRDSISDSVCMEGLGLNENEIETIEPGAFKNLPSLKFLILSDNRISQINENVFNPLNVEELFLNNNSISVISQRAFDNMPNLRKVHLTSNKISRWDKNWFFNCPKIKYLEFNNNQIQSLPFRAFKNFNKAADLEISLDFNKISRITENMFKGIQKLESLRLSANNITSWRENALKGISLTYLDVSDNKLRKLNGNLTNYFVAFYTDIDNNPWNCTFLKEVRRFVPEYLGKHWIFMDSILEKCYIPNIDFNSCSDTL